MPATRTQHVRELLAGRSRPGNVREHEIPGDIAHEMLRSAFWRFAPFATPDGLRVVTAGQPEARYAFLLDPTGELIATHTETYGFRTGTPTAPDWIRDLLDLDESNQTVNSLAFVADSRRALIEVGLITQEQAIASIAGRMSIRHLRTLAAVLGQPGATHPELRPQDERTLEAVRSLLIFGLIRVADDTDELGPESKLLITEDGQLVHAAAEDRTG